MKRNAADGLFTQPSGLSKEMPFPLEKNLLFVLGGARSGKSSWALRYAEEHYGKCLFLATARILDEEMAERVRLHKEARGPAWQVVEEPLEIAEVLRARCGDSEVVLIDCLTVWLGNVLLEREEALLGPYQENLLRALSERERAIIIVANEVGAGIVPDNALGRTFRDLAGRLNQKVAALASNAVLVVAGLPLFLKGTMREDDMERSSGLVKSSPDINPDLTPAEIWALLSGVPDEPSFVRGFNSLEESKRREVAEHVLTRCNVFSGRASVFSSLYKDDSALME
jgi:adenosylcobinamide kinase/adenosylcobinamide-phosphate guanylyltransferase